jgi:hypothetical protein
MDKGGVNGLTGLICGEEVVDWIVNDFGIVDWLGGFGEVVDWSVGGFGKVVDWPVDGFGVVEAVCWWRCCFC